MVGWDWGVVCLSSPFLTEDVIYKDPYFFTMQIVIFQSLIGKIKKQFFVLKLLVFFSAIYESAQVFLMVSFFTQNLPSQYQN